MLGAVRLQQDVEMVPALRDFVIFPRRDRLSVSHLTLPIVPALRTLFSRTERGASDMPSCTLFKADTPLPPP